MAVLLGNYDQPWFGSQLTKILLAISAGDSETAVRNAWFNNGWGPAKITVYDSQKLLPGAVAAEQPNLFFVGISGTDNLSQLLHYATPVAKQVLLRAAPAAGIRTKPVAQNYSDDRNPAFWNWGTTVADLIKDAGSPRPVLLCGHSYGGAVATATAVALANVGYPAPIYLVTFGAPKLGTAYAIKTLSVVNYVNWVNDLDPIPALPPSQGEIGWPLKLLAKGFIWTILPNYKFAGHGKKIHADGVYWASSPDPLSPGFLAIITSDKFLSDQVFTPSNHFLKEYARRLALWDAHLPPAVQTPAEAAAFAAQGQPRAYPRTPPSQYVPAVQAALQTRLAVELASLQDVVSQLGYNGLSLFSGGSAMPYVPPSFTAKKQKHARDWGVTWEGDFIATGTRTQCLSLQKVLNHFLRRLQVMGGFDPVAFNAALSIYVNEATAGGLGFKPDILPIM